MRGTQVLTLIKYLGGVRQRGQRGSRGSVWTQKCGGAWKHLVLPPHTQHKILRIMPPVMTSTLPLHTLTLPFSPPTARWNPPEPSDVTGAAEKATARGSQPRACSRGVGGSGGSGQKLKGGNRTRRSQPRACGRGGGKV